MSEIRTLPLIASSITYHGLFQTGIASDSTARNLSNAASIGASWWTGNGIIMSIFTTLLSSVVSQLTTMGEQAFAEKYLINGLTKRVTQLQESLLALEKQTENSDNYQKLHKQVRDFINKINSQPTMQDYATVYELQIQVDELLKSSTSIFHSPRFTR